MRRVALLACALACALGPAGRGRVHADPPRVRGQGVSMGDGLPTASAGDADPLADGDLDALAEAEARARRERASRGPVPPELPVREGEVLTAPSGVRETAHAIEAVLDDGLASVAHTLDVVTTSRGPVELRYRLAVPVGAWLAGLEVCEDTRCREGLTAGPEGDAAYDDAVRARPAEATDAPAPVAHARRVTDARGDAVIVRAAPVRPGHPLRVRVRWIASAPVVGGVARVVIPARGEDPRAAAARLTVRAPAMLAATADGLPTDEVAATVEPWFPVELAATLPRGAPLTLSGWRARCGKRACTRFRVASGARQGGPVSIVLLLDASPSTLGPARGRVEPALAALLGAAPSGSQVRAVAFGARAETVLSAPVAAAQAPLGDLAQAAQTELGSATRLDVALRAIAPWLEAPAAPLPVHVVLVGDGGLTASPELDAAFATWRAGRARFSVIDLGERPPAARLAEAASATGGVVVHASPRDPGAARLEERLAALFAPVVADGISVRVGGVVHRLPPLRAGEERVWQAPHAPGVARLSFAGMRAGSSTEVHQIKQEYPRLSVGARAASGALAVGLAAGLSAAGEGASLSAVRLPVPASAVAERAASCTPHGPATHASGVSSDAAPVALVEPRTCRSAPPAPLRPREPGELPTTRSRNPREGRGVPAETLLAMLRARVVPAARACFRADRAGRADYAVRASIAFALADRELVSTELGGDLAPALRACLLGALDALEVPRFEGTVIVRYPVYTEAAPPPPILELGDAAASGVDGAFGDAVRLEDVRGLSGP